jgi:hypothetical protein
VHIDEPRPSAEKESAEDDEQDEADVDYDDEIREPPVNHTAVVIWP